MSSRPLQGPACWLELTFDWLIGREIIRRPFWLDLCWLISWSLSCIMPAFFGHHYSRMREVMRAAAERGSGSSSCWKVTKIWLLLCVIMRDQILKDAPWSDSRVLLQQKKSYCANCLSWLLRFFCLRQLFCCWWWWWASYVATQLLLLMTIKSPLSANHSFSFKTCFSYLIKDEIPSPLRSQSKLILNAFGQLGNKHIPFTCHVLFTWLTVDLKITCHLSLAMR